MNNRKAESVVNSQALADERRMDFETLMSTHERYIRILAGRLLSDHDDIEDLLQETRLSAYRGFKKFQRNCLFITWIHRIEVNECIKLLKRKRLNLSLDEKMSNDGEACGDSYLDIRSGSIGNPDKELEETIRHRNILRVIADLPPHYAKAVWLRDVEEFSYKEVAYMCNIKIDTIKAHISRGRAMVRKILADENSMYDLSEPQQITPTP